MRMSVKSRIVAAMTLLVAVNVLTAGIVWFYSARSGDLTQRLQVASETAHLAGSASAKVTQFNSDANALALSLAQGTDSPEVSAAYGRIIGADATASRAIRLLQNRVRPGGPDLA